MRAMAKLRVKSVRPVPRIVPAPARLRHRPAVGKDICKRRRYTDVAGSDRFGMFWAWMWTCGSVVLPEFPTMPKGPPAFRSRPRRTDSDPCCMWAIHEFLFGGLEHDMIPGRMHRSVHGGRGFGSPRDRPGRDRAEGRCNIGQTVFPGHHGAGSGCDNRSAPDLIVRIVDPLPRRSSRPAKPRCRRHAAAGRCWHGNSGTPSPHPRRRSSARRPEAGKSRRLACPAAGSGGSGSAGATENPLHNPSPSKLASNVSSPSPHMDSAR